MPRLEPGIASLIPAILKSLDRTLGADLAPEIASANGKALVDMMRRLLRWSIVELEQHQTLYAARIEEGAAALRDDPTEGAPAAGEGSNGAQASGLYKTPTPAEKKYFRAADQAARSWLAEIGGSSAATAGGLASRLRRLIEAEARFHAALDPESAADVASAFHGGKSTDAEETLGSHLVTIDSLNAYLRRRFPESPRVEARNLHLLTGGMGKDTYLFDLDGHPSWSGPVVMRKDLPLLALDLSAVEEFPLIQAVYAAGVKAPEPLWAESDPAQLGTRFIVVRRARGSVALSQDVSDEKVRRHFADKLAEGLAAIHSLDPKGMRQFREAADKSVPDALRDQIAGWKAFWVRKRLEPSVKLELAFAWLEANIPEDPGYAPTLVHADYGFHNLMMEAGEVTAILDWEFSHVGDPAEDVNYCRQFIARYVPFEYFLECYLRRGGRPYTEGQDRFFTVWRNVRNAVASIGALRAFCDETPGNIKMATAGLAYNPRFELEALRLIAGYIEKAD
jgi:aminoglycoside phosphotransferase (APT) family kinase protein